MTRRHALAELEDAIVAQQDAAATTRSTPDAPRGGSGAAPLVKKDKTANKSKLLWDPDDIDLMIEQLAYGPNPIETLSTLCGDIVQDLTSKNLDIARDAGDLPDRVAFGCATICDSQLLDGLCHLQTDYQDIFSKREARAAAALQATVSVAITIKDGSKYSMDMFRPLLSAMYALAQERIREPVEDRIRFESYASIAGKTSGRNRRAALGPRDDEIINAWDELGRRQPSPVSPRARVGILAKSKRWKAWKGKKPLSQRQLQRVVKNALNARKRT